MTCRGGGMVDTEALRAFALKKRESSTLSRGTQMESRYLNPRVYTPIIQEINTYGFISSLRAKRLMREGGYSEASASNIQWTLRNARRHHLAERDYHLEEFEVGKITVRYDPEIISTPEQLEAAHQAAAKQVEEEISLRRQAHLRYR